MKAVNADETVLRYEPGQKQPDNGDSNNHFVGFQPTKERSEDAWALDSGNVITCEADRASSVDSV